MISRAKLGVLLTTVLLFSPFGCQKQESAAAGTRLKGKLLIKGSNTFGEELGPRLLAGYKTLQPDVQLTLESKGTATGFQALFSKACDIAAASRVINNSEIMQATTNGIDLNIHAVGSYAVAVLVNASNSVSNLSRDQIRDAFIGKIQNWKQVGGADLPIHLNVRHGSSGTRLGFKELAMENQEYAADAKTYTNYAGIVEAVSKDPGGIGYCSFDLLRSPGVKAISVRGTPPSVLAVNEARYPFARILRLYTAKGTESEIALDFINYVQSPAGQKIVSEMGYVPRP